VIALCLFVLMIDAMFFPPVMTVFDRERNVMIVHRPEWIIFGTRTEIPFEQISGFSYKIENTDGVDAYEDAQYADLFANTSQGAIFIGENQVGTSPETVETVSITGVRQREIDNAVKALQLLIGK
jgi:hypothetical protein